jgi:probable DNA repair protein
MEPLNYRDVIFTAGVMESIRDEQGPPLAAKRVKGGTRVLADQSACPFRAFARHRLGAEGLEAPAEGPDAIARGQLLHTLMARLWGELKTSAALERGVAPALERAAAAAVAEARLEGRFAALERERLARLAREWLEIEKARDDFEVLATEEPRELEVAGLALRGRIDRLDRLADGSHLLIDYKTGRQLSPRRWMGKRPDEPQLPLYAVTAKEDISAVAFAKLRHGEMRFMGYARDKDAVPKLTRYDSWDDLLSDWRKELESLARGFASGDARVDPKDGLKTCRTCDLQPLCRVHERLAALGGDEEAEEGE